MAMFQTFKKCCMNFNNFNPTLSNNCYNWVPAAFLNKTDIYNNY